MRRRGGPADNFDYFPDPQAGRVNAVLPGGVHHLPGLDLDAARNVIAGGHDVAGKVQQGGAAASISASSAASAASNSASSANARVHSEL